MTDACIDWGTTVTALDKLREAVRTRRAHTTRSGTGINGDALGRRANGAGNGVNGSSTNQEPRGFNDDALDILSRKGARNLA